MIQRTCAATLHHLIIPLHVGSDEDDLSTEPLPCLLEKRDSIRSTSSFLGVPENHPLGLNVFVNQARYRGSKCLFLVRAYPDEEPRG